LKELYIIDGYNFIFNYFKTEGVDKEKLTFFRDRLVRDLAQYSNFKGYKFAVVFDAKNSLRQIRSEKKIDNVEIIYSRSEETADSIIEKLVHSNEEYERIFVITSDYMQQKVVFKKDIYRKSIREFAIELEDFKKELGKEIENLKRDAERSFYMVEKRLDKTTRNLLEDIRKDNIEK
jgi:predicted RNA-binding protein with PIN domain